MKIPTNNFKYLWNDLPGEERKRLMPHMVEAQKLHIWQCKLKAVKAHNTHMKDLDDWAANLEQEIDKYKTEVPAKDKK